LPQTIVGYIWRTTARHQIALSALSIAVFLISAVPLELQRRIVNDAIKQGVVATILMAWRRLCRGCPWPKAA